jgi:hypothetical protein
MTAYRTSLIAVPAVFIGFVLAGGIVGCKTSNDKDAPPPAVISHAEASSSAAGAAPADHIAVPRSIEVGQKLVWNPPDAKLGKLILTIPKALCIPNPSGTYDANYGVYVVEVTAKVTCVVAAKPLASGEPITYYYKYQLVGPPPLTSEPQSTVAPSQGTVELLDIAGSCAGCGAALQTGPATLYEQVECIGNKPTVVDEDAIRVDEITVLAKTKRVTWRAQGDRVSIKFQSYKPTPCTNLDNNGVLQGYQCNVNDGARGQQPYSYTVALTGCNNNTPSSVLYKLTLK